MIGGRYRLGPRIGTGGSARVHRAHDERLGRDVAIKLLDEQAARSADPAARQRFEIESRTAAGFSHPNAVTVLDAGSADGVLYLVMELVTGGSLAERLAERGPMSSSEVAELGAELAGALDAAHRYGIVHRDVKPSNVLLDEAGHAKLADFGIARRFDEIESSLTSAGMVMGTRAYVSPEQAAGRQLGPSTDVYSLGVVLYEAATGQRPLPATDRPDGHLLDAGEVDPSIDPHLGAVIATATALDPADRFDGAAELRRALTTALPGGLGAAGATTPMAATPAPSPPRPPEATTVMPGVGGAAAGAGAAWAGASRSAATGSMDRSPLPGAPWHDERDRPDERGAGWIIVVALLLVAGMVGLVVATNLGDDGPATDPVTTGSVVATAPTTPGAAEAPAATEAPAAPAPTQAPIEAPAPEPTAAPVVTEAPAVATEPPAPVATEAPVEAPAPAGTEALGEALTDAGVTGDQLVDGFPTPDDPEQFASLLRETGDAGGERADALGRELDKLIGRDGAPRERDVEKLRDRVEGWVDDGELAPVVGEVAVGYLDRLEAD